jgi:hypothetical protein
MISRQSPAECLNKINMKPGVCVRETATVFSRTLEPRMRKSFQTVHATFCLELCRITN